MTKATWNYVVGMAVAGLLAGAGTVLSAGSANAVVYCKTVGIPKQPGPRSLRIRLLRIARWSTARPSAFRKAA